MNKDSMIALFKLAGVSALVGSFVVVASYFLSGNSVATLANPGVWQTLLVHAIDAGIAAGIGVIFRNPFIQQVSAQNQNSKPVIPPAAPLILVALLGLFALQGCQTVKAVSSGSTGAQVAAAADQDAKNMAQWIVANPTTLQWTGYYAVEAWDKASGGKANGGQQGGAIAEVADYSGLVKNLAAPYIAILTAQGNSYPEAITSLVANLSQGALDYFHGITPGSK